jgi:hypothetical protein
LAISLAIGFTLSVVAPIYAQGARPDTANPDSGSAAQQRGSGTLKDAIELCDRLAGVERDICVRRARENRERSGEPPIGAAPGNSDTTTVGPSGNEKSATDAGKR